MRTGRDCREYRRGWTTCPSGDRVFVRMRGGEDSETGPYLDVLEIDTEEPRDRAHVEATASDVWHELDPEESEDEE